MKEKHGLAVVWPDGTLECWCGHLGSESQMGHFRVHGVAPTSEEIKEVRERRGPPNREQLWIWKR